MDEKKFNETSAIFADPNFFDMMSFPLIEGNRKECLLAPNSIVLSETAALKYFDDTNPIGKQIRIGADRQVTGVFRDFQRNSNFSGNLVLPLETMPVLTQVWVEPSWDNESDIDTYVLLADNASIDELALKTSNLISSHAPQFEGEPQFQLLKDIHIEDQITNVTYLYILIAIAILILFISSANFLFLFVGIKSHQSVNTGIKRVIGASRRVLFLEYFAEVLLLMVLSIVLAVAFYSIHHEILSQYFTFLPRILFFDHTLLFILLGVAVSVAILSGTYPAMVLSSRMPARIFSSRDNPKPGKTSLVNKLVMVQFTLCIALITGTLMMHKQVRFMEDWDTGYARDELITIPLNMHAGEGIYSERFGAFSEELKTYPAIRNVTMAFASPASVVTTGDVPADWEGKTDGQEVLMYWESVSWDYFKTIGVNIVQGRNFNPAFPSDEINWDTHTGSFILNQSAVQAIKLTDPIGKEFRVWGFNGTIIGVVEDYNFRSMHAEITPMFYMVNPIFWNEIVVRINPASPTVLSDIQTVWEQFVPEYPLELHFVSENIKALYSSEKNLADSLNVFSFLAIVIAAMGLFALTLLSTNRRIKEIGIRKVVGASVSSIVFLLSKDYLRMVAVANVIAWPIAWYAMNTWLQNFAYQTELTLWPFLAAGTVALVIALLTISWQAIRAATTNPVESLRYE